MVKQRRQTRRKQTRRRRSRLRGGANNADARPPRITCNQEDGFTTEMMIASFGRNYNIGSIHDDGYSWTYEYSRDMAMNGIINWYVKTLGKREIITPYTKSELTALQENPIVQTFGAFFLKYKAIEEYLRKYLRRFQLGVKNIYPTVPDDFAGQDSYGKFLDALNSSSPPVKIDRLKQEKVRAFLTTLKEYENVVIDESISQLINTIINRVHCVMFYIVKNKGMLPEGFRMDDRIEARARKELPRIEYTSYTNANAANITPIVSFVNLRALSNWINLIFTDVNEFTERPLTFGVFE